MMEPIGTVEQEDLCQIRVFPIETWVEVWADIVPLYCPTCAQQLPQLFRYTGSYYGNIGEVACSRCGNRIYCWDHEQGQCELYCSQKLSSPGEPGSRSFIWPDEGEYAVDVKIDLAALYAVNTEVMDALERTIGPIFPRIRVKHFFNCVMHFFSWNPYRPRAGYKDKPWTLSSLIRLVCERTGLSRDKIPQRVLTLDERFPHMPRQVVEWINLLKYLQVI